MEKNRIISIPLQNITINDEFWKRYIRLVKEVIIPYQWDSLNDKVEGAEPSGCINNFKIASGQLKGEYVGAVFQDTDVAKWLEAVAYTLAVQRDADLEGLADEVIELIGRAQGDDGYLNTYFTIKEPKLRWTNLKEGHELYTAGHMIEAAVAYYQATGKRMFLDIVERFAKLICSVFGPAKGKCHGYPGHQEIELALVKLYQVTGKEKYLETAKYFIDRRGVGENYFIQEAKRPEYRQIFPEFAEYDTSYSQSHLPVREQKTAEGHAVRAVYMYCAMADLAWYYKDESLLKACETLWDNMVTRRMYITGSIGSSGMLERFTADYDLPNDCNYSETCASIGLALFGKRMAEITKDGKYMDVVESALYNTVLAGIALDGKSFFYVNPLEVWPDNCMERTSKEHVKPIRQKWFGVACCPPNIARTLASLGQYLYFADDRVLYVNLYVSNKIKTRVGETEVEINLESDLLNTGKIKLLPGDMKGKIDLALRIPGYTESFKIKVNGIRRDCPIEKGYVFLEQIGAHDVIEVECAVPVRFVRANPLVRADVGKVALVKGPVVYCLEEIDNGTNLAAVYVNTDQEPIVQEEPDLLGGVVTLSLKGCRLTKGSRSENGLYSEAKPSFVPVELKAVPYSSWCNREPGEMLVWMKELI